MLRIIRTAELTMASKKTTSIDADGMRSRQAAERRKDGTTADVVDVGLLFAAVFGRDKAEHFFRCTIVEPFVWRRILLGIARRKEGDEIAGSAADA